MSSRFTRSFDVKILDQLAVHQGYFQLDRLNVQIRLFAGGWSEPLVRELFKRSEAVGVLLFDPLLDQIILVEQFRAGIVLATEYPWLMEIVAGSIDPQESAEQAAVRETEEEAGLVVRKLIHISQHWVSPGASNERITLYCGEVDANKAQGFHGLSNEGEDIRLRIVKLETAFTWLEKGKIDNASTLISLLWLQRHEQLVRKVWSNQTEVN